MSKYIKQLKHQGFSITKQIFSDEELNLLISEIDDTSKKHAIRQLINQKPKIKELLFSNRSFIELFNSICDKTYFLTKAIYFNKPSKSNWFVSYHQDLSISVTEKLETKNYISWTNKNGQLGVIPPIEILESTVTFRIHLDKTDNTNGALKVVSKSHKNGIIRIDENFNKSDFGDDSLCNVEKGAVMLMKPLLLHSSQKSISENDRRVIHLEFCNQEIPMKWLEKRIIN